MLTSRAHGRISTTPYRIWQVGSMLETRSRHQEAQEYAAADALEEELGAMGIVIDRRNR